MPAASCSSLESLSAMVYSDRLRALSISQRSASAWRRDWRTSTGTWYVAPPTRRERTSTVGLTFSSASWKTRSPLWPERRSIVSRAP